MKKLLTLMMSTTLAIIPGLTVVSCGKNEVEVKRTYDENLTINKMVWNKDKNQYEPKEIKASENKEEWQKDLQASLDATGYGNLVTRVLNLLNANIIQKRDADDAYQIFRGKKENTNILGQWSNANNEVKTQEEFYKLMDDSDTHISSIKGLLELKKFGKANPDKTKEWKESIKKDWEKVEKWDDEFVLNLNQIVNSSNDNMYSSVKLISEIKSSSSSFSTFAIDKSKEPTEQGEEIKLTEVKDKILGDLTYNKENKNEVNEFVFGTNRAKDPYGSSIIGNKGMVTENLTPELKYSSKDLTPKKAKEKINLAEENQKDKFKYNWNLSEDKKSLRPTSEYDFYYLNAEESDSLKLQLTYNYLDSKNEKKDFVFNVDFKNLYKVFIPIFNNANKADNKSTTDTNSFGWSFVGYRFSDAKDYSENVASFKDIELEISKS
ncbi:Hypothetical protein, predicted lipoprotein [Mycoplasma yeatsii 13926]|uniref:Lipoprotein n=1 Tax=Mycoplasma yeatsii 13926 TaxID=1188240 RepID=S6G872_9MOLU|nr:hypothetical protein [Mycoplasma yeatsii]EOA07249.1 Hypothetical protein, predicted lipoprotein [Mycoplasma yeatsii 13926]